MKTYPINPTPKRLPPCLRFRLRFRAKPRFCTLLLFVFVFIQNSNAQQQRSALFIGNSYTEVNNLPQMVADIAESMGDQLTYRSNTPGGCTFQQHCQNQSMQLISQGGWDIVVLQEQSQYPSFPQQQVENEVFPYAQQLVEAVYHTSPCAEPMFYMTWGRKNGDQQNAQYFPILGTYEGMDSMLCLRYTYMADAYDASLCPVGRVWNRLRNTTGIELYQADGSHPSLAGTYAAACAFYTMFFLRDPDSIGFIPNGLSPNDAQTIRQAAHDIVFTQLDQWKRRPPKARFDIEAVIGNDVILTPLVADADTIRWDFGDGTVQTVPTNQCQLSCTHHYATAGTYVITLTARRHCIESTWQESATIDETPVSIATADAATAVYPNPAYSHVCIDAKGATLRSLVLTDATGSIVRSQTLDATNATISLDGLPKGIYILKINSDQGTTVSKIVKH